MTLLKSCILPMVLAAILLISFSAFAQEAPQAEAPKAEAPKAKAALESKYVVSFSGVKAYKGFKDAKRLNAFLKNFMTLDKRYTLVKREKDITHSLNITLNKERKKNVILKMIGDVTDGPTASHEVKLSRKPTLGMVEAQIARGIREMFDYQPKHSKVLIKILGISEEGDADAGGVEEAIFQVISSEYDLVGADPYKLPVKDKDIPFLYKGEKGRLKKIAKAGGVDLLIVGTIKMPKTKNIGGPTANLYRGKALVRICGWDLKNGGQVSEVKMDLNGEGIFTELVFSLFSAAAEKSAAEVRKDLGFPEPQTDEAAPAAKEYDEEKPSGPTFELD